MSGLVNSAGSVVDWLPPGVTPGGGLGDNPVSPPSNNYPGEMNPTGTTPLQNARAGSTFTASDPIGGLESLALNDQRNAMFGRGLEATLISMASREGAEERAGEARARAATGADVDAATFARRTAGLDMSERQRKLAGRKLSLSRAIAQADAGSKSRKRTTDLAIGARKGLQDLEDLTFGQSQGGLTMLANAEGQRLARMRAEDAAESSSSAGLWGTIIGVGASLLPSSEKIKDKRGKADGLLGGLRKLRVDRWNYKGEDVEHIGPYAEEFNDTFKTGNPIRGTISVVDALGVALGAIRELDKKVEARGQL